MASKMAAKLSFHAVPLEFTGCELLTQVTIFWRVYCRGFFLCGVISTSAFFPGGGEIFARNIGCSLENNAALDFI